jgi:very-short-patch-repair endonuclease
MALAARQHGAVSRAQLVRAGVSAELLDHRLRTGRMSRLHRGVYRVGPIAADCTVEMAACLACGDGAAVSHWSAAVLWEMHPRRPVRDAVDVIVTRGRAGRRPGIRLHRIRTVLADELTTRDGVPITTPARTLYDLAGSAGRRELERALAESFARRLVGRQALVTLLDRHGTRRGAGRLRRLVAGDSRLLRTRSEAEERFLALTRKARLPDPDANVEVAGYEVDFLWRAERLVVEVDGRAFHASDRRFEGDRRRDAVLVAAGMRVMRVTWQQIVTEPEALLVRLAQALARPV